MTSDLRPSATTERWAPGPHFHSHSCQTCGNGWCCEVAACQFPENATCLECWARQANAEALPGEAMVVVALAAAILLVVAFFTVVLR